MPASFEPNTPVVFAVGTTNKAKIESVYSVGTKLFPQNVILVYGFNVDSGVSDQPMSADETLQGAKNRSIRALNAALGRIASEGGLTFAESQNHRFHLGGGGGAAAASGAGEGTSNTFATTTAHFGVGLEGGIESIGDRHFECGWMAVAENPANPYLSQTAPRRQVNGSSRACAEEDCSYELGLGSSARFEMSSVLMHKILHEKKELATVMDEMTGETDLRSTLGAMGVLTAGHLGRAAAYEHGLLFAMAPFLSSRKFWQTEH